MKYTITREEQVMLELLGAASFGYAFDPDGDADWSRVYRELYEHRVASVPCDYIADLPLDDKLRSVWRRHCVAQQFFFDKLTAAENEICDAFEKQGIPYVILKGMTAAMNYPVPSHRSMGDIDILIHECDDDRATEVLLGLSYEGDKLPAGKHKRFCRGDIDVELHYHVTKLKNARWDKLFDEHMLAEIDHGVKKTAGSAAFYMFPVMETGIVILQHLYGHLTGEGAGLRQVMDWMMYVHASGISDWTEFNDFAGRVGVYEFQKIVTRMCERYLGLPHRDDLDWCLSADDETCGELMGFILSMGNFGNKEKRQGINRKVLFYKDIPTTFKRIQKGGICRWKAARNHAVLRPFAWMYQLGRVGMLFIRHGYSVDELRRDIRDADDTGRLFAKLRQDDRE